MKINILKLIPNHWNIEEVGKNLVRTGYTPEGRGNKPKYFVVPTEIYMDK